MSAFWQAAPAVMILTSAPGLVGRQQWLTICCALRDLMPDNARYVYVSAVTLSLP